MVLGHLHGGCIHTVRCDDLHVDIYVLGNAGHNIVRQFRFFSLDASVPRDYNLQCEQGPSVCI